MILIRESDGSVLIVICKTPHKMNCSNPSPENDKKAFVGVPTINDVMQRAGNES